jgi:hypothetical protein
MDSLLKMLGILVVVLAVAYPLTNFIMKKSLK